MLSINVTEPTPQTPIRFHAMWRRMAPEIFTNCKTANSLRDYVNAAKRFTTSGTYPGLPDTATVDDLLNNCTALTENNLKQSIPSHSQRNRIRHIIKMVNAFHERLGYNAACSRLLDCCCATASESPEPPPLESESPESESPEPTPSESESPEPTLPESESPEPTLPESESPEPTSLFNAIIANGNLTNEQIQQHVIAQQERIDRSERNQDHYHRQSDMKDAIITNLKKKLQMAAFLADLRSNTEFTRFAFFCGEYVIPEYVDSVRKEMINNPDKYLGYRAGFNAKKKEMALKNKEDQDTTRAAKKRMRDAANSLSVGTGQ